MSDFREKVRGFILDSGKERLKILGLDMEKLPPDFDLITSGLMSSMVFLDLLGKIEAFFDLELDFEELDPSQFTSLEGLLNVACNCRKIA